MTAWLGAMQRCVVTPLPSITDAMTPLVHGQVLVLAQLDPGAGEPSTLPRSRVAPEVMYVLESTVATLVKPSTIDPSSASTTYNLDDAEQSEICDLLVVNTAAPNATDTPV